MRNICFLFFFSVLVIKLNAQDVIIQKNGTEISAKVLEVDSGSIKYKKLDNMNGPTYIVPKSDVFIIKYENGTKDIINNMDEPEVDDQIKGNVKTIFQMQKNYFSAGYGLGTYFNNLNSNNYYQELNTSLTGPFYFKYEFGMTENFGIGVNLAYVKYVYSYSYYGYNSGTGGNNKYNETDTYESFSALLRANWHLGKSDKVDPYFGFGIGYRSVDLSYVNNDPSGNPHYEYSFDDYSNSIWGGGSYYSPFGFETTFGVRMLITKHLGAYIEAGFAKSVLQFGLMGTF